MLHSGVFGYFNTKLLHDGPGTYLRSLTFQKDYEFTVAYFHRPIRAFF